jgi:hypothetical protein
MTGFRQRIEQVFGDVDERRQAERSIQTLRQKGAAAQYTATFQQYAIKTGWGDVALQAQYYQGLKDSVKDEIAKEERPGTMAGLVQLAIRIDNRLYERALERRGFYGNGGASHKNNGYPTAMELDATSRDSKPGSTLSPEERKRYMDNKLCFKCGKPRHMANRCGKKKHQGRKGKNELNATYEEPMQLCVIEAQECEDLDDDNRHTFDMKQGIYAHIAFNALYEEAEARRCTEEASRTHSCNDDDEDSDALGLACMIPDTQVSDGEEFWISTFDRDECQELDPASEESDSTLDFDESSDNEPLMHAQPNHGLANAGQKRSYDEAMGHDDAEDATLKGLEGKESSKKVNVDNLTELLTKCLR